MKRLMISAAAVLGLRVHAWAGAAGPFPAWGKEFGRAAKGAGMKRIAVLPFEPTDGRDSREGVRISEELVTHIVRSGKVQAVERSLIKRLMEEHVLARTGAVESVGLRRLGKIMAVEGVLTGSYAKDGSALDVNARLIDVETGLIIAAERSRTKAAVEPAPSGKIELASLNLDPSCRNAARRVDTLELAVLDLKARYWASEIEVEGRKELAEQASATITDPAIRSEFLDLVGSWSGKRVPHLTREEVTRFISTDQKAFTLHESCGL